MTGHQKELGVSKTKLCEIAPIEKIMIYLFFAIDFCSTA
jgi:hypothetical protein